MNNNLLPTQGERDYHERLKQFHERGILTDLEFEKLQSELFSPYITIELKQGYLLQDDSSTVKIKEENESMKKEIESLKKELKELEIENYDLIRAKKKYLEKQDYHTSQKSQTLTAIGEPSAGSTESPLRVRVKSFDYA